MYSFFPWFHCYLLTLTLWNETDSYDLKCLNWLNQSILTLKIVHGIKGTLQLTVHVETDTIRLIRPIGRSIYILKQFNKEDQMVVACTYWQIQRRGKIGPNMYILTQLNKPDQKNMCTTWHFHTNLTFMNLHLRTDNIQRIWPWRPYMY